MFTGIVTAVGRVSAVARNGGKGRGRGNGEGVNGLLLTIRAPYKGLKPGESIAVNGACLTVERVVRGGFTVHAVETTTGRTLLGEYATGRRVNLERAPRAEQRGDAWVYDLRVPRAVREVAIPHGAIAVDGVSLTINDLAPDFVQISLIPFTRRHTTLGTLRVGDRVHVEGDVLGKYVRQLCSTAT